MSSQESRINFSAYSIRKPLPAILLFVVLLFLGIMSFKALPVTRFPNIDIPLVQVTINQSGATPAELETQVAKIVEELGGQHHRREASDHVLERRRLHHGHRVSS